MSLYNPRLPDYMVRPISAFTLMPHDTNYAHHNISNHAMQSMSSSHLFYNEHRLLDGGPPVLGPSSILNYPFPHEMHVVKQEGTTQKAQNETKGFYSSAYNSSFASTVVKKEEDGINDWKVQSKFSVPAVVTNALSFPYAAPYPSIQNIVATVDLGQRIDLKKLTLHSRNTEYNPKRFSAVIMRIREPRTTALIFSSGKMVTTGAKSESASRQASRKFARIVQKVGFNVKFADFKIQNVVGSCDVRFAIQLEGLCIMHAQFSTYEPELFPGLIYRMVHPRVVLLIFVSGKVVITGARHQDDIDQAFNHIYPILKRFRK